MTDVLSQPQTAFAFYAGLNGLLLLILSILVVRARVLTGTSIGDGGHEVLMRATRAHGNACEYVPILLIVLFALAWVGAPLWIVHAVGAGGTLGRVMHAAGLSITTGRSIGRGAGTLLTWLALLGGSVAALIQAFP